MLKKRACRSAEAAALTRRPQAQFLWRILRDSFNYAACPPRGRRRAAPRSTSRCAGASTGTGPFELWQRLGWSGRAAGEGRHRRRQGASERAAAGLGLRWPRRCRRRRGRPEHADSVRTRVRRARARCRCRPASPFRDSVDGADVAARSRRAEVFKNDAGPRLDARRRGADRAASVCQLHPHQPAP